MMVADFRQVGTADCSSEMKMVVKTSASWSAQALKIVPAAVWTSCFPHIDSMQGGSVLVLA